MPSANDFATRALRLLGVIDPTETPSAEDAETAFNALNDWIDGLGTQRLTIHTVTRSTGTYASSSSSITIGSGGTFNIARPLWIEAAAYLVPSASPTTESPLTVWNDQQYQAELVKAQTSTLPTGLYYDYSWTAGLGNLILWPIPTQTLTLVLYCPTALTEFADYNTDYTFPPGYRRAITFNLANELVPWYPSLQPDPRIAQIAAESMANIKRANARIPLAVMDPALLAMSGRGRLSAFNYRTGQPA